MPSPTLSPATPRLTLEQHLYGPGPKRILSLDGGGVLGVIEVAFLERIEAVLREQHGGDPDFRLSDYFDLIGGTSTGAVLATGLSLGWSVAEAKAMYFDMSPKIFAKERVGGGAWNPLFKATGFANILRDILGDRTFDTPDLKTGLAMVAKRLDTGSVWALVNSPRWKYWNDLAETDAKTGKPLPISKGNARFKLRELVRASAAAPYYFDPQKIDLFDGEGAAKQGLFVDGGTTPHNNPALLMLMLARMLPYGLNWRLGRDDLLLVSIGAGYRRGSLGDVQTFEHLMPAPAFIAWRSLRGMVNDCIVENVKMLQWLSSPLQPWHVNGELETQTDDFLLSGAHRDGHRALLSFQRYDLPLTKEIDNFVDPDVMGAAYDAAQKAAVTPGTGVRSEHFPTAFHLSRLRTAPPDAVAALLDQAAVRDTAPDTRGMLVGIVSERANRLAQPDQPRLRAQLEQAFAQLAEDQPGRQLILASGLGEGADRFAAEVALERGGQLLALLPFSRARYLKDFGSEASRAEFSALLARSSSVSESGRADLFPDPMQAYRQQRDGLVACAHALIAIWDGGAGSTAIAIAAALEKGIPVFWISPDVKVPLRRL